MFRICIYFSYIIISFIKNVKSCNRQSDVLINRIGTRASNDRYNEVSTTYIDIALVISNKENI